MIGNTYPTLPETIIEEDFQDLLDWGIWNPGIPPGTIAKPTQPIEWGAIAIGIGALLIVTLLINKGRR